MRQESSELADALEDANHEIDHNKRYLNKLMMENSEYYKRNYAKDAAMAILNGETSALFDIHYISTNEQTEFREFVESYIEKIRCDINSKLNPNTCKQNNSVVPGSVEEIMFIPFVSNALQKIDACVLVILLCLAVFYLFIVPTANDLALA